MKRNLVTLLMLIGIFSSYHAQVGINEQNPKASLHVGKISTADTNVAEGVLIPRVTTAELSANTSYTKDQNGALVFVTDNATGTGSTENINGKGFYFYDGTEGKWKPAAPSSSAYGSGSFTPVIKEIKLPDTPTPNLAEYAKEGYNFFEFYGVDPAPNPNEQLFSLSFPKAADFAFKTIYLRSYIPTANSGGMFYGVRFTNVPEEFSTASGIGLKYDSTLRLYSDGKRWYLMSGVFHTK